MAIHALTSITGSPGVTTTALAWAYLTTRPTLIVEADPTGGSAILAGLWDGAQRHDRSVLDLANYPAGEFADRLWASTLQLPGLTQRWVLPAIGSGQQSVAMMPVWPALAATLRAIADTGTDVLIDAGRITAADSPWALVDAADTVLVLTRTNLQSLNALAIALPDLRESLTASGTAQRLGVVAVQGGPREFRWWPFGMHDFGVAPYAAREVREIADPIQVVATLPSRARQAAVYSNGLKAGRLHARRSYVRTVRHLIEAATEHAATSRSIMSLEGDPA